MPIRILDSAIVGRIAAGEVVERPSSVVKELVENSIDAGASSVTVEIKGGGIDYLRVTDNGCGIEPGQVRLAFENHATSKLATPEQLDDIRTLGFRGEALPSIAAVSRVEMTTRVRGANSGIKFRIEGGNGTNPVETGCPEGTTIIARDLFFNVPVRRAFLKKPQYEASVVGDMMARLIIGNPGISIKYINNGKVVYHSFGDDDLRHAIFAVYGRETAEHMKEVNGASGGMQIRGLIGYGEQAKATRAHQMFFINGRSVKCQMLTRLLEDALKGRVMIGTYPMCALNLRLPANSVDVNVHPNKLEIRFRDEQYVRSAVADVLDKALNGGKMLKLSGEEDRSIDRNVVVKQVPLMEDRAKPENSAYELRQMGETNTTAPDSSVAHAEATKQSVEDPGVRENPHSGVNIAGKPVKSESASAVNDIGGIFSKSRENQWRAKENRELMEGGVPFAVRRPSSDNIYKPDATARKASNMEAKPVQEALRETDKPDRFRVIGTFDETYILVEAGKKLIIIDQHAAHERILYEKYAKMLETGDCMQYLLIPVIISLSSREMSIINDNLDVLREAGFEVEVFGDNDIQIRAVPHILGRADLRPVFMDVIDSLGSGKFSKLEARRSEVISMACKRAVKAGDRLSKADINALVELMLETEAPPTCPHGRPVAKVLTVRELEHMFKRIQ